MHLNAAMSAFWLQMVPYVSVLKVQCLGQMERHVVVSLFTFCLFGNIHFLSDSKNSILLAKENRLSNIIHWKIFIQWINIDLSKIFFVLFWF